MKIFSRLSLPLAAIASCVQIATIKGESNIYEDMGPGRCRDANNHDYDRIKFLATLDDENDDPYDWCSDICLYKLGPANHGRGFDLLTKRRSKYACHCLFEDGKVPIDILEDALGDIDYDEYEVVEGHYGTGVVRTIDPTYDDPDKDWTCYRLRMDKYYEQVGWGECQDRAGEGYDRVQMLMYEQFTSPCACAAMCHDSLRGGLYHRGFEIFEEEGEGGESLMMCACLFDNGEAQGEEGWEPVSDREGAGPIWAAGEVDYSALCYRNRMDDDYSFVGEGYCKDTRGNNYDFAIHVPIDPSEPPQACAELCLPSNVGLSSPDSSGLPNFRGFVFEQYIGGGETETTGGTSGTTPTTGTTTGTTTPFVREIPNSGTSSPTETTGGTSGTTPTAGTTEGTTTLDWPRMGETRQLSEGGSYCLCQYDDGILEDYFGEGTNEDVESEYLDFIDVITSFNGTGDVASAAPLSAEEEEESYYSYYCYEYLPKFEISVPGVLSVGGDIDICELDEEEREAFIRALTETIKMELGDGSDLNYGNMIEPKIEVEIGRLCNQVIDGGIPPEIPFSEQPRKLQTSSSWQIEYSVILSNILCGSAGCTSFEDINGINALISSISDTLQTSIQNGNFVSQLTSNQALQAAIDTEILGCLVIWGSVYAASWGGINTNSVQVTQTQGVLDLNVTNQLQFYPDWAGLSGTCLNDGNEPLYMKKNPSTWLYNSLEDCCARYYPGWNEPECLQSSTGTGLWYVDYAELKCVTDCSSDSGGPTCGGLAPPNLDELYANPLECCEAQLQWLNGDFCESVSLTNSCYVGTGKFYRGSDSSEVCVRDCPEQSDPTCGGIVEDAWVRLHDDASACCSQEFDWIDNDLCTARSEGDSSEKYWADMTNGKCTKDSVTQAKDMSVPMFDSPEDCCSRVHWVNQDKCVAEADGLAYVYQGTEKYYVKSGKCVKDCEAGSGTDCGGFATKYDPLSDTKTSCCNERLWWLETSDCVQ